MKDSDIDDVIKVLKKEVKNWKIPIVTEISDKDRDPFKILIGTVLSLRTKDETTGLAAKRLFKLANTPEDMVRLKKEDIERAIYPVGFYRNKAQNILNICRTLIDKYNSKIPDDINELLKLKGVGRKTANLVITLGYNKLGICVDTHVHRISNRLGYIKTKNPHETEEALKNKLPKKYWIIYNDLLVALGQNICRPISPFCSRCPINRYCDKVGIKIKR
jgi:endonuclease-3